MTIKQVTEHPTTLEVIRGDYEPRVTRWLYDHLDNHEGKTFHAVLDQIKGCTILQLRAFCQLIDKDIPTLTMLPSVPSDHLGVRFSGMYVGIETDGYTHS